MRSLTTSKKWTIFSVLAVFCAVILAVSLLFSGNGVTSSNMITDNTDSTKEVSPASVEISGSSVFATGGTVESTSDSGDMTYWVTATPEDGYELGYWTRTLNAVTTKFATTKTVEYAKEEGKTFDAVFVSTSDFVSVSSASELQTAMTGNKNIKLTADINLTSDFTPIATFAGLLDGMGHTITVNYTSSENAVGGLCATLTGVIKNVVLTGCVSGGKSESSDQYVGGFASAINGGLISNCENRASVYSPKGVAGSFVAQGTNATIRGSTINSCCNCGSIMGGKVGAIIFANGTKDNPLVNLVNNKNTGAIQTTTTN